ncbi:Processing alpha glucosidase I [Chytridiales sp. JEL 0842]|nr:Processing alpha glucosidase I [Chytridiales sp. JEL 0842]
MIPLQIVWISLLAVFSQVANAALDEGVVANSNASLFWGTYRPNLYLGTRTRSAETLLTGLMWHGLAQYEDVRKIRHSCEEGDGVKYAWDEHDGRSYGKQSLTDKANNLQLKTEFLKSSGGKHGGDWALRVTGKKLAKDTEEVSAAFYYYISTDGAGKLVLRETAEETLVVDGQAPSLGDFSIYAIDGKSNDSAEDWDTQYVAFDVPAGTAWEVKRYMEQHLINKAQQAANQYGGNLPIPAELFKIGRIAQGETNTIVIQKIVQTPFQFDIVFLSHSAHSVVDATTASSLSGPTLSTKLTSASAQFSDKFEAVFRLKEKGFDKKQIKFAKMLLSNMLGGLGYFHGTSIVDRALEGYTESQSLDFPEEEESDDYFGGDDGLKKPEPNPQFEGPTSLFTAVPSRPFFPRGFLWDEGFHQMLIGTWDNDLSLDIISHWSSLIDDNGWVGREQILGDEARSKVPKEFQTQYSHFANPPTMLMSLTFYLQRLNNKGNVTFPNEAEAIVSTADLVTDRYLADDSTARGYLEMVYSRFMKQYKWFRTTQWGEIQEWDRSSRSNEAYRWRGRSEYHTLTSGLDDYPRGYPPHQGELHVDLLSWVAFMAKSLKEIASFLGKDSDRKMLETNYRDMISSLDDLHWNERVKAYCDLTVNTQGKSEMVVHLGYITLFPFILGLVPNDSPKIEHFLSLIRDEKHLWTPYGLRSLSASDEFFGTGENYWRGPIWININYLTVRALHRLKSSPGPYQSRAETIYTELRENLISNTYNEYRKTGFIWEQYSPVDGKGKRSHPFTGWSSLVTLIMAEKY